MSPKQPKSFGMKAWFCGCANFYESTGAPAALHKTEPAKDECHRLEDCGWYTVQLVKTDA